MIIAPHQKISREVSDADIPRVLSEVDRMRKIFENPICLALAHPQVDNSDPLRFFVTAEGGVFINPRIEQHSGYTVDSAEGCMTFPGREQIIKQRWRKVELRFQSIEDGKLSLPKECSLSALRARIAQHEIDHLDGNYCYDL